MRRHEAQTLPGSNPQTVFPVAQHRADAKIVIGVGGYTLGLAEPFDVAILVPVSKRAFATKPEAAIGIPHQVGPSGADSQVHLFEMAIVPAKPKKASCLQE